MLLGRRCEGFKRHHKISREFQEVLAWNFCVLKLKLFKFVLWYFLPFWWRGLRTFAKDLLNIYHLEQRQGDFKNKFFLPNLFFSFKNVLICTKSQKLACAPTPNGGSPLSGTHDWLCTFVRESRKSANLFLLSSKNLSSLLSCLWDRYAYLCVYVCTHKWSCVVFTLVLY